MTTEQATKERPILFSGPMVKAILEDRKTQTRRVIKSQPELYESHGAVCMRWKDRIATPLVVAPDCLKKYCPYGNGDRLWVRETWAIVEGEDAIGAMYRATHDPHFLPMPDQWKPSIFMPRWASRITLEITDVRVERVQDISEGDAWAEGIRRIHDFGDNINFASWSDGLMSHNFPTAREAFAGLWNEINASRGYDWDVNPWVWVVSFKRVQS